MKTILQKDIWSISSFLENKEYKFNKENILTHLPEKFIEEAIEVISSWKSYSPTPLIKLNKLDKELKLKNIYYKDEDKRFDLKSFKALGGAFAVYKVASEKKNITVSTATAGNHGRSVAWGAQRLGLECKIFISENVSESRAAAMRDLGSDVIRVTGNYDNSLKECIEQSNKNKWEIVQDVSWEGYKEVPKMIMAGYTIIIKEIFDEIDSNSITHVFLQAGVVAAGLHGLNNKVDPGEPLSCNMYTDYKNYPHLKKLPNEIQDALEFLQNSKELKEAFGEDVITSYIKLKNMEIKDFNKNDKFDKKSSVTHWEKNSTLDC